MEGNIYLIEDKAMVSNAVMWELTKNFNSFLVKRRDCGVMMSSDPFNLTNEHRFKESGNISHITVLKAWHITELWGLPWMCKKARARRRRDPRLSSRS